MIQESDNSVAERTFGDAQDAVIEAEIKMFKKLISDISSIPKHYFNNNFDYAHIRRSL